MDFTKSERQKVGKLISSFPVNTELSVAKITKGRPTFYGAVKSETQINPIENHDSIFEIGSISKVLTSSLLAKMALDDGLNINSSINPLFPIKFFNNQEITYKSLSTHTSGLPRLPKGVVWKALFNGKHNPYARCNEPALIDYLQNNLKLKSKKSISYSNLGVGLLGVVLEKYSGTPFGELINNKVLDPLNMANSSTSKNGLKGKFVQGLDKKGNPSISWDLGYLAGAGAVLSSIGDLTKFIVANFDGNNAFLEYQRKSVVEEKHQCMSLGWFILDKAQKGERFYFHNGGTAGFSSAILMDVKEKNAFIILSNISGLHKLRGQKVDQLIFSLMRDVNNAL